MAVQKLDANGNLAFSRSLPASFVHALAIDSKDDIYVLGDTPAPGAFPFTAGLALTPTRDFTAFITKLRGQDGTIVYATSLGSTGAVSIVVDTNGQVLIAASNTSEFLTTPGAYSSPPVGNPGTQVYVVRLSEAGDRVIFSARYGGIMTPCNMGVACSILPHTRVGQILLDGQGNIWLAGGTDTIDMPVTPQALQSAGNSFLAEFSADGSRLLYATYIGGGPTAIAADTSGHIWMVGQAGSDFPVTANALQGQRPGFGGAFVAEYDSVTNRMLYSTYFGGDVKGTLTSVQIGPMGRRSSPGTPIRRRCRWRQPGSHAAPIWSRASIRKRTQFL